MKKQWKSTDGWRGYYEPVPPAGWELLVDCHIVNNAGNELKAIIGKWLRSQHIKFRSGYLRTSNLFAMNLYIIVEAGKIAENIKSQIEDWFVDYNNSTFSIFSGEEYPLKIDEAKSQFANTIKELALTN